MPRPVSRAIGFAFVLCLALPAGARQAQPTVGEPLTVMSFNIRYGTANDGENHWLKRREFLFDVIRQSDADLIGAQEALDAQLREIVAALPGYGVVGVGRDDGRTRGEYAAILFRTSRLHVADSGTFWFSDTPERVASRSWGNTITRICTWARFVDRDGRAFWHYNVHLDHQSQPSREKSTVLLAERIASRRTPDEPALVTGDFNAGEDNPALTTMFAAGFADTFRARHPETREVGTFTGFDPKATTGPKIDYVMVPIGSDVLDAAIVRTSRDGRYPSDHFPVTARVRLPARLR
jgi:endonuclease/exonuclease/phosphatase family metal-dependent hydrolase